MQGTESSISDTSESKPKPPQLLAIELRVLGVLMEKQLTTPDQYPLTLNSIITACNQKSNREPISNYHQGEVQRCLNELEERHFVRKEYGSRADKYSQQFVSSLELGKKQQAVLCVMMLRGAQTISELVTRTQRMQQFSNRDELVHCVERLCERELPYVQQHGAAGQRSERFAHLFSGTPEFPQTGAVSSSRTSQSTDDSEMQSRLESQISSLQESVQQLERDNQSLKQDLHRLYQLTGHALHDAPSDE